MASGADQCFGKEVMKVPQSVLDVASQLHLPDGSILAKKNDNDLLFKRKCDPHKIPDNEARVLLPGWHKFENQIPPMLENKVIAVINEGMDIGIAKDEAFGYGLTDYRGEGCCGFIESDGGIIFKPRLGVVGLPKLRESERPCTFWYYEPNPHTVDNSTQQHKNIYVPAKPHSRGTPLPARPSNELYMI